MNIEVDVIMRFVNNGNYCIEWCKSSSISAIDRLLCKYKLCTNYSYSMNCWTLHLNGKIGCINLFLQINGNMTICFITMIVKYRENSDIIWWTKLRNWLEIRWLLFRVFFLFILIDIIAGFLQSNNYFAYLNKNIV